MDDLVSIIMLSHNQGKYVEESIRSVINQTYWNWELIFIDDSSKDNTIEQIMPLKKIAMIHLNDGTIIDRVKVIQTVFERGVSNNSNSALKEAKGRWVAFLNAGDVWEAKKLERQVAFMEKHGYAFSYHQYRLMDAQSKDRGILISGKECVTHKDMLKCCWPGYLTVMYDLKKVGKMKVRSPWSNYYAMWLNVSDNNDCYFVAESLASLRTKWERLGNLLLTNSFKWRYDAYRVEENFGRFTSLLYTIRNMWYGFVKWKKYVNRVIL